MLRNTVKAEKVQVTDDYTLLSENDHKRHIPTSCTRTILNSLGIYPEIKWYWIPVQLTLSSLAGFQSYISGVDACELIGKEINSAADVTDPVAKTVGGLLLVIAFFATQWGIGTSIKNAGTFLPLLSELSKKLDTLLKIVRELLRRTENMEQVLADMLEKGNLDAKTKAALLEKIAPVSFEASDAVMVEHQEHKDREPQHEMEERSALKLSLGNSRL